MIDKEIKGRERTLVVFKGCNGVEYKILVYSCVNLETKDKLSCSDVDCFRDEIECKNCIFRGKSVNKDKLKFIVRGLEVVKDKDQRKEDEGTKKFVEFEDNEGNNQILPMLNGTMDNGKLSCKDVSCVYYSINCSKCPFSNGRSLDASNFKILELKGNE